MSRSAAGTRVVTCGCSEKCGFRLPSYDDHGPRATYETIAAHLRGRYDRWGLSQSRDGVGTPAMSVALYSAARSRPQVQPQLGAHRRMRPNRRPSAGARRPPPCKPSSCSGGHRAAARRIGKPSTARSAALGGGGQPAHPLPPSSRTAAFRGSLRATRAPRSAAVGQPFLVETIFGLRAPSRPRARVAFLGGLERSLALLAPSSRRLWEASLVRKTH